MAAANNSHSESSTAHLRAGLFGGSGGDDPSRGRGGVEAMAQKVDLWWRIRGSREDGK